MFSLNNYQFIKTFRSISFHVVCGKLKTISSELEAFWSIEKEIMLMYILEQMWEKILQTCETKHNS